MIRPEFKKLLMDQRGAAVILWSFFMISIVIYIVIAENVLANPKYARGLAFAETARIVLWFLVLVDLGYYFFWKKALSRATGDSPQLSEDKTFSSVARIQGAR